MTVKDLAAFLNDFVHTRRAGAVIEFDRATGISSRWPTTHAIPGWTYPGGVAVHYPGWRLLEVTQGRDPVPFSPHYLNYERINTLDDSR
jgi:hypothetical protein